MFGLIKKKYKVNYHGQEQWFRGAKCSFAAGTQVTLVYFMIATDTDYSFYVDGKPAKTEWKNNAYVILFTMPDHDIEVYCEERNSMENEVKYVQE